AAAQVEQWISAINAYYYGPIVPDYILRYALAGEGGPDRAAVDEALPALRERLSILNEKIAGPWLAGDTLTAADLFAGPLLLGLTFFPEGKEIIGSNPKLGRLVGALAETPTFMSAAPPQ
ncbi:MAG: glutathione S-transferase domain-containing protein, partial [Myxococcota bacterium]